MGKENNYINPSDPVLGENKQKIGRKREELTEILSEVNIANLPENRKVVEEQMVVKQYPEGYDEIIQNINNEEKLKELMNEQGIKKLYTAKVQQYGIIQKEPWKFLKEIYFQKG